MGTNSLPTEGRRTLKPKPALQQWLSSQVCYASTNNPSCLTQSACAARREGIAVARTKPAATRETAARLGYARAVTATILRASVAPHAAVEQIASVSREAVSASVWSNPARQEHVKVYSVIIYRVWSTPPETQDPKLIDVRRSVWISVRKNRPAVTMQDSMQNMYISFFL